MDKNTFSKSDRTTPATSKRIKNTFVSDCNNEYFVPATLHSLCRYGFPFDEIPEEAKKMVLEFSEEYYKRCTKPGDKVEMPPFPTGPGIIT
ncbi:MAG: hypothetical protein EB830_00060 [Nitrosopumilus sp. H13]|nr:MAG: hypothetical protein EB830_00060 [Nitrosopumilus sp. H13]